MKTIVHGYDFDGVVSIGINPSSNEDIIITGRCVDEQEYVLGELSKRGIYNRVIFNPMLKKDRGDHSIASRTYSGMHKSKTIFDLKNEGISIDVFFEDDPIQYEIIKSEHPDVSLVFVDSNLVKK